MKLAERRHEVLFFHEIDRGRPSAEQVVVDWGEVPTDIFPPRKLWNRYRPKDRPGMDTNLETLLRAVRHLSTETRDAPWAKRLKDTVEMIRRRALSDMPFVFSPPTIFAEPKASPNQFRPLASFCLSDKIIDCLTARYFREALDGALLDCCFGFRPRKWGRNEAMDIILHERQHQSHLFVAECDIQGFFDCVSHEVARQALKGLITDAQLRDSTLHLPPRALDIFEAYLSCYTFPRNVRQGAEVELQRWRPEAEYPWPEGELRELHGADLLRIGLPQGGALSGLMANAVLHSVDKEMMPLCKERSVTYLRYCDDMILLGQDRASVEAAFEAYCSAVRRLKLPIHPPQPLKPYQGSEKRSFWAAKSKGPYMWGDPRKADAYPWIQFLGYQIRFDGAVRVRQSSVNKEAVKLTRVSGRLLDSLQPDNLRNLRRTPDQIARSIRMKLTAMAVGRRKPGLPGPVPRCWANGFRWLAGKATILNNLRVLDRQRERQINRVVRRLKALGISETDGHYGFRFSYIGQFLLKGRSHNSK